MIFIYQMAILANNGLVDFEKPSNRQDGGFWRFCGGFVWFCAGFLMTFLLF